MGRITYANVAATTAVVLAAGGFAVAKNPGEDGVIRGCLKEGTKVMRVPDSGKCRSSERKLSWSQTGLSGYEVKPGGTNASAGESMTADSIAKCPRGKKAIGGGYSTSGNAGVSTVYSKPFGENQWIVRTARPGSDEPYELTAYAVCADAAGAG